MFAPQGPSFFELMQQALSSTDRGYELLAEKFDHTPFRTPTWALDIIGSHLRRLGPFDRGMDLCCGTGALLGRLADHCRQDVTGVDRVPAMLRVAEAAFHDHTHPRIEFVQADARALPFREAFDVVTCAGAFGHIERKDERLLLQNVYRALKPGGHFVFLTGLRPRPTRIAWWLGKSFNAVMHLRNILLSPPFIMFYLTFLLPEVEALLEQEGFDVDVCDPQLSHPRDLTRMVVATRRI